MNITIRDLTKDDGISFKADVTIQLPVEEAKLKEILGDDEWIIVDAPLGDEHTSILKLNEVCNFYTDDKLEMLSYTYLFEEIAEVMDNGNDFIIICYDEVNNVNGFYPTDEWLGFALFKSGYAILPFEYDDAMEDYIKWDQVWRTAESEGWRRIPYDGRIYMVNRG